MLTRENEANIPKAGEQTPSWQASTGEGFVLTPEQVISAETWVMTELTFVSTKSYADPFEDVDIDLLLCGNGRLYTIPGFWDGGNIWKVRLVCPSAGDWYYKTVCTDGENISLDGRTGKIICAQYSGDLDIYKRGFVTTSGGNKYFTYDDGTPFFYLGDTHWSLGDETTDMVSAICDRRASQGFTVFQSEPIGADFNMADGVTDADMSGFADYDAKFKIIADSGLVHANAEFFFPAEMETLISNMGGCSGKVISGTVDGEPIEMRDFADSTKEYLEKISRYWVARYGAYPVMWTLGQEVDRDFYWGDSSHPGWNFINNPYKLVAGYIDKYDAYDHPLSAHQENSARASAYGSGDNSSDIYKIYNQKAAPSCFRDVDAHNFFAAQWNPAKVKQSDYNVEKDYWYNSQGKPVINYEGLYCYLWTKNFGSRMQGWTAYLNGMYGYGWGGHDTWSYLNIYDEENDSTDGLDIITSEEKKAATWQDSLNYPSSYQVGYMRRFLENTQWYNLIPRFDNKAYFTPCGNVYYSYASNADNSEVVIYFYSFTDETVAQKVNTKSYGGVLTGTVGSLSPGAAYSLRWFNPVTGEYGNEKEFTASPLGTYFIGEKPTGTDMALWIKQTDTQ